MDDEVDYLKKILQELQVWRLKYMTDHQDILRSLEEIKKELKKSNGEIL